MHGECKGSQDKKIMMVSIGKGPWKRRCGTKERYEEKSTTQEENHNRYRPLCNAIDFDRVHGEFARLDNHIKIFHF